MDTKEIAAWKQQVKQEQARQRAKALRYKRPALATLGWNTITDELQDIIDACEDIRWIEDSGDVTQEVLDGDEDEGAGFRMDFAQLAGDAERLQSALWDAMRMTKAEMISTIGQNFGILLAFYDLRQRFDYAKAALATATEHNLDTLRAVKAIEEAYDEWASSEFNSRYGKAWDRLERAANDLPDVFWIS